MVLVRFLLKYLGLVESNLIGGAISAVVMVLLLKYKIKKFNVVKQ